MVVNIPINSTFLTYLAALSVIMVFPVNIVVQGCICVGLANYLALLNWSWKVYVINFQPPQSPTNNRLWYAELGRYFLVLVIYGLHVHCACSSYSSNSATSFNTHAVHLCPRTWICAHNIVIVCKGLCEVHSDYVSGITICRLAYRERGSYRDHWYFWLACLCNCVDCKHYLWYSHFAYRMVVHYTDFTGCYVNDV